MELTLSTISNKCSPSVHKPILIVPVFIDPTIEYVCSAFNGLISKLSHQKQYSVGGALMLKKISLGLMMVGAALLAPAQAATPDDWPDRNITVVVPYPPGGSADIMGRLVANRLALLLAQVPTRPHRRS